MARGTFSTSNYFSGTPPTAFPITVSLWFKVSTASETLFRCDKPDTDNISLVINGTPKLSVSELENDPFAFGEAIPSPTVSLNTWYHACGIWVSSSSRIAYLNGANKTSNTTTVGADVAGFDDMGIGGDGSFAGTDSSLAEFGMWDVQLTDDEVAALGKGFSCHLIRPGNLIKHIPLIRNEQTLRDSDVTETGTVPVTDHPPIIGAIAA